MDLSILKIQDPTPKTGPGERRRRVRQKLHTPVYASFSGPHSGMVLDLSELLDVHEDGFAVQTSEPLEVNRAVNVCLDLPETKTYIHGNGHVVWSDGRGRAGIRFSSLPEGARRQLKEWLLVNLLIACAHRAARAEQLTQQAAPVPAPVVKPPEASRRPEPSAAPVVKPPEAGRRPELLPPLVGALAESPVKDLDSFVPNPVPDLSVMLSAVEAVRRETRSLGNNFDAVIQLITERAMSLTGASGAALAFLTDGEMICRARAGDPAPPLGARVDARRGLSGECVRSARLISCADSESDARVDREICRKLGIGSILAAPILSNFKVVGLIEVFSTRAHAFPQTQETALELLVEIVPDWPSEARREAAAALPRFLEEAAPSQISTQMAAEQEAVSQERLTGIGVRWSHLVLLGLAIALVALALGYVLAPTIEKRWLRKSESPAVAMTAPESAAGALSSSKSNTLEEVRKLAAAGDPGAQYELGVRYHNGDGVSKSDAEAVKWFGKAAEQGHVVAQAMLGYFYWVGEGVPKNIPQAYFWSVLARAGGDEASKYRIDSMLSHMTTAQAAAIQQQAEKWLHDHPESYQQNQR